jgi:hypothetical protein
MMIMKGTAANAESGIVTTATTIDLSADATGTTAQTTNANADEANTAVRMVSVGAGATEMTVGQPKEREDATVT